MEMAYSIFKWIMDVIGNWIADVSVTLFGMSDNLAYGISFWGSLLTFIIILSVLTVLIAIPFILISAEIDTRVGKRKFMEKKKQDLGEWCLQNRQTLLNMSELSGEKRIELERLLKFF